MPGGIFRPVEYRARTMELKECGRLEGRDVRLLKCWGKYILRFEWRSEPVFQFLPLSHVLGTMVCHRDFTDSVAKSIYGVFSDCTVKLTMEKGDRPGEPAVNEFVRNLNGLTVLFLACVLLFDQRACARLLEMPDSGLVILRDLRTKRLADFCATAIKDQVAAMMEALYLACGLTVEAWCQRLSLLVSAHLCRAGGRLSRWVEGEDVRPLLFDVLEIGPVENPGIPPECQAAAIGFFCGNAVGTLRQLLSERIRDRERRGRRHRAAIMVTAELSQNAVSLVQTVTPFVAGGGTATPFTLQQTQAWLLSKIDNRTANETHAVVDACYHLLRIFDEQVAKFQSKYCARVDIKPFLSQCSYAYSIAMCADPSSAFRRSHATPLPETPYEFIGKSPSKDFRGISQDFWRKLLREDLDLAPDTGAAGEEVYQLQVLFGRSLCSPQSSVRQQPLCQQH